MLYIRHILSIVLVLFLGVNQASLALEPAYNTKLQLNNDKILEQDGVRCRGKAPTQSSFPLLGEGVGGGVESNALKVNSYKADKFVVNLNMPGLYNAYNALAAIAMCLQLNVPVKTIIKGLESYNTIFGRAELITLKGKPTLIQLIKNPVGATEVLRTVKDDKNGRLLIIINDNYADGRDVSWLWDANFELLSGCKKEIITSGIRASDMAVRLKYAGVDSNNIKPVENIKKALSYSLSSLKENEKLYILPTYTALLQLQSILKKF